MASCRKEPPVEMSGATMGTTWHLKIARPYDKVEARDLLRTFQMRLDDIEARITSWKDSPVTRFNESQRTDWITVPRELAEMVKFSEELSKETNGAFDVTIAPLVDLWGFGAKGRVAEPPADAAIAEAMKHVGWNKLLVKLDPPGLRKTDPLIQINVSAMADGYAVDELTKLLRKARFKNFLLEVGGAVRAEGVNDEGQPWRVGVQQPFAKQGEAASTMPLQNRALSTSGVYRQYFEKSGKRYAHLLDARTGRPVDHALISVSVVMGSCFEADGWDTALMILGPVEGRALAAKRGMDAMFLEEGK